MYLLGGYAAGQIMVYNWHRILREVNIKLHKGCALEAHKHILANTK